MDISSTVFEAAEPAQTLQDDCVISAAIGGHGSAGWMNESVAEALSPSTDRLQKDNEATRRNRLQRVFDA